MATDLFLQTIQQERKNVNVKSQRQYFFIWLTRPVQSLKKIFLEFYSLLVVSWWKSLSGNRVLCGNCPSLEVAG